MVEDSAFVNVNDGDGKTMLVRDDDQLVLLGELAASMSYTAEGVPVIARFTAFVTIFMVSDAAGRRRQIGGW
ncbi:MAG: hypothetical protein WDM76_19865 [Limisphaerales bacterium]